MKEDIDFIKTQFCRYKCNVREKVIDHLKKDVIECRELYPFSCMEESNIDECKICPIDDFIREMNQY